MRFFKITLPNVVGYVKAACELLDMDLVNLNIGQVTTTPHLVLKSMSICTTQTTVTAGSDVVQSGRPIFDDFFQHLWPYIGNNTANIVIQMVKRLWLIRIDQ
ncbi:hypothetical protein TNCV_4470201 [Trichonephila clavipes]|nr:hypothetical protein TNCV_4470201 [Trichonephila clavipes]